MCNYLAYIILASLATIATISQFHDRTNNGNRLSNVYLYAYIGHEVYEFVRMYLDDDRSSATFIGAVVHHTVSTIAYISELMFLRCHFYAVFAGCCEISKNFVWVERAD